MCRRFLAVLLTLTTALVTGCSAASHPTAKGRSTSASTASAQITASRTGIHAVVGAATISAPAGVAPVGTKLLVHTARNPLAKLDEVSVAGSLDLKFANGAQPAKPVTVTWKIGGAGAVPAAATKRSGSTAWQPLKVARDGTTASITLTHFSFLWFGNVGKMVSNFTDQVKSFLGVGYPAPGCVSKPTTVDGIKFTVTTNHDSIRACTADDSGTAAVRLYPNTGQVYRVRGEQGKLTPYGLPLMTDITSILTVEVGRQLYGTKESVVLPGDGKRYTTMHVAQGVTSTYGDAQADPALSLLPIASLGIEMLLTISGEKLPVKFADSNDAYHLAQCVLKEMPLARGDWGLSDALSAVFSCAPTLSDILSGGNATVFSIIASLAGSAVGLFVAQIQGIVNQLNGNASVRFTVSSHGSPPNTQPTGSAAPAGDANLSDLKNAQVPAYCAGPARKLMNGSYDGKPYWMYTGTTLQNQPLGPVFIDMAGTGRKQGFGVYTCVAGAPSWPSVLELIGPGGKMLGYYKLGDIGKQEHATVSSMRVTGRSVTVEWDSYDGCCGPYRKYRSVVSWRSGKLVSANTVVRDSSESPG